MTEVEALRCRVLTLQIRNAYLEARSEADMLTIKEFRKGLFLKRDETLWEHFIRILKEILND